MKTVPSVKQFRALIWDYYAKNKRAFAWRRTNDPYKILVSEIMLQQTQTSRVKDKYSEWLRHFPTVQRLADARLSDVLKIWRGLGYNRRALNLKKAAEQISTVYKNKFPRTYREILALPGVGPYTAGAVMAFAYNHPVPIIETNIRTVFIHYFFNDKSGVHDNEILGWVEKTLDKEKPGDWYYALMDYGAMIKKIHGNANIRSRHYSKQSRFAGSNRQLRSAVLMAVMAGATTKTLINLHLGRQGISNTPRSVAAVLTTLITEGFIKKERGRLLIA